MKNTIYYNSDGIPEGVPTYLFDHADTYRENPHEAGLEWFLATNLGLSVFYGLSSLTENHERDCWKEKNYKDLTQRFNCEHFEAFDIVELAIAAGARYISMPACFRDGFALFNSECSDFNSVKSPAQRDLVGEIASVCEYHGIGLHLVYAHGFNAQSLSAENNDPEAIKRHLEFVKEQLHELLINYGPIAAISLDGLEFANKFHPKTAERQDLYDYIHSLQPQTLIGYEQGYLGTEDFHSVNDRLPLQDDSAERQGFVLSNPEKPIEVKISLTPGQLSYNPQQAGKHLREDAIWEHLRTCQRNNVNLLLNTALMPDGSLDLEDIDKLIAIGKKMEKQGLPR